MVCSTNRYAGLALVSRLFTKSGFKKQSGRGVKAGVCLAVETEEESEGRGKHIVETDDERRRAWKITGKEENSEAGATLLL